MSDCVHVSLALRHRGRQGEWQGERQGRAEFRDVHLRACVDQGVDDDGGDRGIVDHADVLYFARTVSAEQVVAQLAAHPGCAVCAGPAADGGVLLAMRGGRSESLSPLIASVVHALLAGGPRLGLGFGFGFGLGIESEFELEVEPELERG
jgi:hypothetical protein